MVEQCKGDTLPKEVEQGLEKIQKQLLELWDLQGVKTLMRLHRSRVNRCLVLLLLCGFARSNHCCVLWVDFPDSMGVLLQY